MRVLGILLFTLALRINSIVCSDDDDDERHKQYGAHSTDFKKRYKIYTTTPEENANIRIMYDDGTDKPKAVVENLDMIARGQTIIGYDGKSRGLHSIVHPIYSTKGELIFQHKDDRCKTWEVPFKAARRWGVMYPSPSDLPYAITKKQEDGRTSRHIHKQVGRSGESSGAGDASKGKAKASGKGKSKQ